MTYTLYPTATAGSLNEPFVKEDVTDLISNLFPLDTQFSMWLDRMSMDQVQTEFPLDTYSGGTAITRTADTGYTGTSAPVRVEGHIPTDGTANYGMRLRSVAELHIESDGITGTTRATSMYGITDRYTLQALKLTRKVVNDFEHSFWWGQGTAANGAVINPGTGAAGANGITGANDSFPRQTQGVVGWITRTGLTRTLDSDEPTVYNAHGEAVAPAFWSYAYNAGNINLDAGMFNADLMTKWWDIGGEPDRCVCFVSPKVKALFRTFALQANGPINERKVDAASKMVYDTIDAYETDNGLHFINRNRYLNIPGTVSLKYSAAGAQGTVTTAMDEVLIALMPSYWKIGVLRPVGFTPLAKTGDIDRFMVTGEMGLACLNPIGGAAVVNCVA